MLIKVIDIGSNSVKATLFRVGGGQFEPATKFKLQLALGQEVFSGGSISKASTEKVVKFIKSLPAVWGKLPVQNTFVVATSAVRSAANRSDFTTRVLEGTGLPVQVLTGEDESFLIHMGAISSLPAQAGKVLLNVDIGGGSMEVSWSRDHDYLSGVSLPLGAIRMTRGHMPEGSLDEKTQAKLNKLVRKHLEQVLVSALPKYDQVYGSSGNLKALGKMVQRLRSPFFHSHTSDITLGSMSDLMLFCRNMTPQEIQLHFQIGLPRARIIMAAMAVLYIFMQELGIERIAINQRSLREGVVHFWLTKGHLSFSSLLQQHTG